MLKKITFFVFLFISTFSYADDCLDYKLSPNVKVITPLWEKTVVQPLQDMDVLHGNVIATLIDNYEITADITSIEDGFCVSLKDVETTLGYSDFLVQIDKSYKKNTCSYDAVLSHEDEHIRAYLSIIDDNQELIKNSIKTAADSIIPVFVKNEKDIESAIDKLNEKLQNHPEIILLKQHIKTDEEIRNKYVDEKNTSETLKKCTN